MKKFVCAVLSTCVIFMAFSGWADEGKNTGQMLDHWREYSSTLHGKEEMLRLLQLDLEKVKLESEIKKVMGDGLSGEPVVTSSSPVKPEGEVFAGSLPVLNNISSGAKIRRACFQVNERLLCAAEGESFGLFSLKSVLEDRVIITNVSGDAVELRLAL